MKTSDDRTHTSDWDDVARTWIEQAPQKLGREYSEALGIAYQIRDDLDDFDGSTGDSHDFRDLRPSLAATA